MFTLGENPFRKIEASRCPVNSFFKTKYSYKVNLT